MPIEKKRYAVADFAIATAAIIEEKSIIKNKRKARGKSTKKWLLRRDEKWLYNKYLKITAENFNELLRQNNKTMHSHEKLHIP